MSLGKTFERPLQAEEIQCHAPSRGEFLVEFDDTAKQIFIYVSKIP